MHAKFGIVITHYDKETLYNFLKLRIAQLREELTETEDAFILKDPEEIVDGLIDLMVFTLGTLDLYGVDVDKAWRSVMDANLAKEVGIKEGRPNPFGLPDLKKGPDWIPPSHTGNHGLFASL